VGRPFAERRVPPRVGREGLKSQTVKLKAPGRANIRLVQNWLGHGNAGHQQH
jgi:hypothetical protein